MNLMELKPKHSKLKLKAIKEELILRPITLNDEVWLDQQYGAQKIAEIFEQINIMEISRIVYRLLTPESKLHFKKQSIELIDEDGNSQDIELGGVDLLRTMVIGWEEKLALMNALLDNIGVSRPEFNEDSVKKKEEVTSQASL